MPRVVPSQVVELIDELFPFAAKPTEAWVQSVNVDPITSAQFQAIVDLVQRIPDELVILQGPSYSKFVYSVAAIRTAISTWHKLGKVIDLAGLPGMTNMNPVSVIRQLLASCPDEYPAAETAELGFIKDQGLRENLRQDVGRINRTLCNGEWKATTVLAGSVVEALLLWGLERCPTEDVLGAKERLLQKGVLSRNPGNKLKSWELHPYIEVAADLGMITEEAATQARLAKDFRNLIHPGREIRLGVTCDRGTALSAVAAVELVVRDMTSRAESL